MLNPAFIAKQRSAAIEWARRVVENAADYVIVDFETTGIDKRAEIIQIGVLGFENGEPRPVLDTLVRPAGPVSREITQLTGITNAALMSARRFVEHYGAVGTALAGKTAIAYNVSFDMRILAQTCTRYELGRLDVAWECAMEQYATYYGAWNSRRGSFRWHKLANAAHQEGIHETQAHQALADCLLTWRVIEAMARAD